MKFRFKFNDGFVVEADPSGLEIEGEFLESIKFGIKNHKPFKATSKDGQYVERDMADLKSVEVLF